MRPQESPTSGPGWPPGCRSRCVQPAGFSRSYHWTCTAASSPGHACFAASSARGLGAGAPSLAFPADSLSGSYDQFLVTLTVSSAGRNSSAAQVFLSPRPDSALRYRLALASCRPGPRGVPFRALPGRRGSHLRGLLRREGADQRGGGTPLSAGPGAEPARQMLTRGGSKEEAPLRHGSCPRAGVCSGAGGQGWTEAKASRGRASCDVGATPGAGSGDVV